MGDYPEYERDTRGYSDKDRIAYAKKSERDEMIWKFEKMMDEATSDADRRDIMECIDKLKHR